MKFFAIKVPRKNEYTIEQTYVLLSNLEDMVKTVRGIFKKQLSSLSLEIASIGQQIFFVVGISEEKADFFIAQLVAQFRNAVIEDWTKDFIEMFTFENTDWHFTQIGLARPYFLPIKTFDKFVETAPLSSILATLAKSVNPKDLYLFQIVLSQSPKRWQVNLENLAKTGGGKTETGEFLPHPQKNQIEEKIKHPGFQTCIRILANNKANLDALAGSFGIYTEPTGNSLIAKPAKVLNRKKIMRAIFERKPAGDCQILNLQEISSLWHIPTAQIVVKNIAWGKELRTEPPENLPVAEKLTTEEKKQITFFAKTEFKNKITTFGIKRKDRERHIYIIGKTGTGKSTLIANMIIEDIRKGEGVGVIDPHGDLIQTVLNFIPSNRINDVCYFNPADPEYSYPLNPLEVRNTEQRELVSSGIVAIFHKLYAHTWGPRLEYILRNSLLTLTAVPNTTLEDVVKILTDDEFRRRIIEKLEDKVMVRFWTDEYNKMDARQRSEAISPILNKVGQFVSSPLIREIINKPISKVNIEKIMNEGKILLVDLSHGKIGEDNSTLLGAMVVTQIQLAAMNRVYIPEHERRPFFLFVDEFQNFATKSFIKIFSEARKYKLNLTVANQYMAQLDPEIQSAALGNVGTLISFTVGAQDAPILQKEFGGEFTEDDLVSLERFQILLKLGIDQEVSTPFFATTLPLLKCVNLNRDKIIKSSQERFGKPKAGRKD